MNAGVMSGFGQSLMTAIKGFGGKPGRKWAALVLVLIVSQGALGQDVAAAPRQFGGLGHQSGESFFMTGNKAELGNWESGRVDNWSEKRPFDFRLNPASLQNWDFDSSPDGFQTVAANSGAFAYPDSFHLSYPDEPREVPPEIVPNDRIFLRGWVLLTTVEVVLLGVTALMPKEWTGWSSTFVKDGMGNLQDAYTSPPVWDTDHWFHNYIGHPYGGNVYYNTVRSQGAKKGQSFLFSMALSLQWEYVFEAIAEQPSIQDLLITPVIGSLLGEFVHHLTATFKKNGTSLPEKIIMTILNPTGVWYNGYN